MTKLGLFPRLLIAFLLVIGVAGVALLVAGLTFGPVVLERHLVSMGLSVANPSPGTETMLADLRQSYREALSQSLLGASLVAALIAGGVSFFITAQVVTPLRRLGRASERIARGNYRERLDVSGPGEVGSLAQSFNRMAEALETGEAQRVELLRNLAHEVRTPLTNLRGYIEGLEEGLFEADAETYQASKRQLTRLERLLDDLSLLSRVESQQEQVNLERVALETICLASLQAVRPQYLQKRVDLYCKPIPPDLTVKADPYAANRCLPTCSVTRFATRRPEARWCCGRAKKATRLPCTSKTRAWASHQKRYRTSSSVFTEQTARDPPTEAAASA